MEVVSICKLDLGAQRGYVKLTVHLHVLSILYASASDHRYKSLVVDVDCYQVVSPRGITTRIEASAYIESMSCPQEPLWVGSVGALEEPLVWLARWKLFSCFDTTMMGIAA